MASKQSSKQVTSAAKTNEPARKSERQPRRRISRERSKSAATQTSSAAGQAAVAPEGASEGVDLSTNTTPSLERQISQSKPPSESTDLTTANELVADRPRASTKRAVLIGMLERPQGASVAEIGQRLGWLPHTVRDLPCPRTCSGGSSPSASSAWARRKLDKIDKSQLL